MTNQSENGHPSPSTSKKVELLGRRLRKLRKERKLSPAQVLASAGIDPQDLARIERGDARVGLETLFRLLAIFEVDAQELMSLVNQEAAVGLAGDRFRRELPG
ncbi:MAG TPA: helix-turn-helix transcriptional regulator [Thermoanaerobaculia bacterium]|jgi:transcriptional regulator with XRE-family HTH domain|nr:helix-turn-helix transcriptional regulator [Thermoanaerobaculia bacterium]